MTKRTPRGLYFEDFEVGKTYRTPRRTVTQTDIVNFACLSGDFNAPHVDWSSASSNPTANRSHTGRWCWRSPAG